MIHTGTGCTSWRHFNLNVAIRRCGFKKIHTWFTRHVAIRRDFVSQIDIGQLAFSPHERELSNTATTIWRADHLLS